MPKNPALKKVMIIGSGPIVIGQAAEFDFSGSQACKSVREEGIKVTLVNSNPATIQTDPTTAEAVYVEPLTVEFVEKIIAKERPDGILSGMGGQTALNLCSELAEKGILAKYGVALLGSSARTIEVAEDRDKFRELMNKIGEPIPRSHAVSSVDGAKKIAAELGYPVIVRAAFTLGGTGSGIAHNEEDIEEIAGKGLIYSRIGQVLVEECVLGWGEFEYEVMRDSKDNCIIICNMENIDPMGIHTGESIVVAPAQTLSDKDHQMLRNAALKIIRALGIEGGCNIQFALNYDTGQYYIIEVNPRVSRSSALASKATGYPIARTAAKIAIGMTLDEIKNPITGNTYAAFEPALDYVITKIPRWPFDKFRTVDRHIGTSMKSTGEVMAIGRSIEESLQKAIRSLEIKRFGFTGAEQMTDEQIDDELRRPTDRRLFAVAEALRREKSIEWVEERAKYNRFFIQKIKNIIDCESELRRGLAPDMLARAKQYGFSNRRISELSGKKENEVADMLGSAGIAPKYNMADTCAAEFEAVTPYYYSTHASCSRAGSASTEPPSRMARGLVQSDNNAERLMQRTIKNEERKEAKHPFSLLSVNAKNTELLSEHTKNEGAQKKKILVIGAGPIRIGQGIEFDYCCVHAAL
ncbi:MAG: carbamoyl-phosphate synthase large subunit, partial [Thermoplasmata archaeon HGW-Thermoplasmata-2]